MRYGIPWSDLSWFIEKVSGYILFAIMYLDLRSRKDIPTRIYDYKVGNSSSRGLLAL